MISNLYFIYLDRKSNFGNIENAKLHDIKEGYSALERQPGEEHDLDTLHTRVAQSNIQVWKVRLYITLCGIVLLLTWISFGIVMEYRRS